MSSFNGSLARHWATSPGNSLLSSLDSPSAASIEKPKLRSMSANRAQSVAQAGVIQMNSNPNSLMQLFLDNARMWDCLCLIKSDPTLQCETAIRIIFSLDDVHFLSSNEDMDGYGLEHHVPKYLTSAQAGADDLELEKQRLMIENSRLHAILWVLRDNPNLQIDSTVAAVFRMDDVEVQEKFGNGVCYSPGCLSLLMKMGSKWKAHSGRRSPNVEKSASQMFRYNRSRSASSKEMRNQVRRVSGVKPLLSWKARKLNTTANWKATVSEDREPSRKSMKGNTILLMAQRNEAKNPDCATSQHRRESKFDAKDSGSCPSSAACSTSTNNLLCNTNGNGQPQVQRSLCGPYLGHSNNAEALLDDVSTLTQPNKNDLSRYRRRFPSLDFLDDFYLQQRDAMCRSLLDFKEHPHQTMPKVLTNWDERKSTGEGANQTHPAPSRPIITLSKTPACLQLRGKPYPLPKQPTPQYFIERHGQMKTDFEYPVKSDLKFCFNSKLRSPNLVPYDIIGPIDADNRIMKPCDKLH